MLDLDVYAIMICLFNNTGPPFPHLKFSFSFKIFSFIQKCYVHSRTYYHSKTLFSFNNLSVCINRYDTTFT